jgi:Na+-driven multidrug efflux pump
MSIKAISKNIKDYTIIIVTGFPSLCRQGLGSIASITMNATAAIFGDAAVAAISVNNRIFQLLFSVLLGFGQGYQPVIGFNYGAKRYDRVKESFKFTFITSLAISITVGITGFIFAPTVISWFSETDQLMIQIGITTMRFQCIAIMFQPVSTIANMTFQSIGKSLPATILSCCRQGIFFFPLIYLLPKYFDLLGIEMTQAGADLCTCLFCIPFIIYFFRFIKKEELQDSH